MTQEGNKLNGKGYETWCRTVT